MISSSEIFLTEYNLLKFIDMQYPGFSLALVSHVTFFPNLHTDKNPNPFEP